ncbi:MAG: ABC transporter permease subunit [Bacteroidales bacterium]
MRQLISIELFKIFTKPRTYIGFGAVFIIVLAIQAGIYIKGDEMLQMVIATLSDKFIFEGKLINMYGVSYIILNTLWIHIPILVALVTGDLLAGEANAGTYRILLTRPVSRTKLVISKFIAGWIYSLLLVVLMIILSIGVGWILFGPGDMLVMTTKVSIIGADDVIWRFAGAYAYGMLCMTTVAALSFFLSSFSDNSIGPIIGTIALIIGITIISTVGASLLEPVLPFFFTTYLTSWQQFFDTEFTLKMIGQAILVQGVYIVLFTLVTLYYFRKKDILT